MKAPGKMREPCPIMTPRDDPAQLQEEGDQTAEEPGGGPRVP